MPNNNNVIPNTLLLTNLEIIKMKDTISSLIEKVSILELTIALHQDKIEALSEQLIEHPGNTSTLAQSTYFNMWCMQDPRTLIDIDDYFNQTIFYLKAIREYGFSAKEALNLAKEIKIFVENAENKRKLLIQSHQQTLSSQTINDDEYIYRSEIDAQEDLFKLLYELIKESDVICDNLYLSGNMIDFAMKHFMGRCFENETYFRKISQKLVNEPDLRRWCNPWMRYWQDRNTMLNPLHAALVTLPANISERGFFPTQ